MNLNVWVWAIAAVQTVWDTLVYSIVHSILAQVLVYLLLHQPFHFFIFITFFEINLDIVDVNFVLSSIPQHVRELSLFIPQPTVHGLQLIQLRNGLNVLEIHHIIDIF